MGPDLEHPDDLAWAAYADGSLGDIARARLALHLDRCPECSNLVARLMEATALDELGRLPAISPAMQRTLGRMMPSLAGGAPAWAARFSVRPKGRAAPGHPHTPDESERPLRPSAGAPIVFERTSDLAGAAPPPAQVAADGDNLVLLCPGQNGVARITWLGTTVDADVDPSGRASIPISAFSGPQAGGAMANRAAAWHRGGAGHELSVEFFSKNVSPGVMAGSEDATRPVEDGPAEGGPHTTSSPMPHHHPDNPHDPDASSGLHSAGHGHADESPGSHHSPSHDHDGPPGTPDFDDPQDPGPTHGHGEHTPP